MSRERETENVHRIEWFIDVDTVCAKVTCTAPKGSPCRLGCEECLQWPCEHALVDVGCCNAVEWFDGEGVADCYVGGAVHPLMDGPIEVWWQHDFWEWAYPERTETEDRP